VIELSPLVDDRPHAPADTSPRPWASSFSAFRSYPENSLVALVRAPRGPHTFTKIRLRYIIQTGTKQTAVKLTE
jgi:hypothetical protein